jgi:hypothetical protein
MIFGFSLAPERPFFYLGAVTGVAVASLGPGPRSGDFLLSA